MATLPVEMVASRYMVHWCLDVLVQACHLLTPLHFQHKMHHSVLLNPSRVGVQLIGRVPRPVREQLARKLAEMLDLVISSNSKESWERLFLFCHNCHHIYST